MLTKEQIMAAVDYDVVPVDVPEWGGTVYIKNMTGTDRDSYDAEMYTIKGKEIEVNYKNMRAKLLIRCLCDDKGELLFNYSEVAELGKKSVKALDRCFEVAQKLNGIGKDAVEDAEKN